MYSFVCVCVYKPTLFHSQASGHDRPKTGRFHLGQVTEGTIASAVTIATPMFFLLESKGPFGDSDLSV